MKQVLADSPAPGLGMFGHLGEPSVPFNQREWRGTYEEGRDDDCSGDQRKARSGGARCLKKQSLLGARPGVNPSVANLLSLCPRGLWFWMKMPMVGCTVAGWISLGVLVAEDRNMVFLAIDGAPQNVFRKSNHGMWESVYYNFSHQPNCLQAPATLGLGYPTHRCQRAAVLGPPGGVWNRGSLWLLCEVAAL